MKYCWYNILRTGDILIDFTEIFAEPATDSDELDNHMRKWYSVCHSTNDIAI